MHHGSQIGETHLAATDQIASMSVEDRIRAEWEAANCLPAGEREAAMDIIVIKHGALLQAALRDRTIAASSNVIRFADAKAKLPKGL